MLEMNDSAPEWITVDALLERARAGIGRLSPSEAHAAQLAGAALVDIRSDEQRWRDGLIPGAIRIPRNVLEWRCDPASPHRSERVARRDCRLVLICNQGYQSSLAAATLRWFGLDAVDVTGGFEAWAASGMPLEPPAPPSGAAG